MSFAHSSYRISGRDRSLDFYAGLGLHLVDEFTVGSATHLMVGDGAPILELVLEPGAEVGPAGGYRHVALHVANLEVATEGLHVRRGPIETPTGLRLAFVDDPDGYEIELIEGEPDVNPIAEASAFLHREASLLDDNEVDAWFEMLHPELFYEVPLRYTQERQAGAGFSTNAFHMRDSYSSMRARVTRLASEYAWAEDPASRTRRMVTNVQAATNSDGDLSVRSNLMLYRSRNEDAGHQLIVGERRDLLRRVEGELRLLRRIVLLDHTTLPTHNLAVFL